MNTAALVFVALVMNAGAVSPASGPSSRAASRPSETRIPADVFAFPGVRGRLSAWSAITVTHAGQIIAGLCRDKEPAYLAHFDDATRKFAAVLSVDTAIHDAGEWRAKQAKIHTQLVELSDGWVYGGTHLAEDGDAKGYAGGHWLRYDPRSHKMEDLGLAMAHEGLLSLAADEPRGCLYAITYPGAYLLRFDLVSRRTQILGKTSRNDNVNRVFFVLGQGTVYTNQVYSPASQPGGICIFDAASESQRVEAFPVYRGAKGQYTDLVEKEAPWLYNYWLTGAICRAGDVAYTTGYHSGHFISLRQDSREGLVVRDHGLIVPGMAESQDSDLFCHAMCLAGNSVVFTVGSHSAPASEAAVQLLRYDPRQDAIEQLGVIRTRKGERVTSCTAMACTPAGRLYLLGKVADNQSVVLLSIDRSEIGLWARND